MARLTPAQYVWARLIFTTMWLDRHFSNRSWLNKKFVVVHHMTIVGNGLGAALDACYRVWQTRKASAHYGVDGENIAQYVEDRDFAWATGSTEGNEYGVSIEHANSTAAAGGWKVSSTTLATGARLVAQIHVTLGLGKPTSNAKGTKGTVRQHGSFTSTACPGPFLGSIAEWAKYVREVQRVYALLIADKPYTPPTSLPGTSQPTIPVNPSTDRMDPKAYFLGAVGTHIEWYTARLILHLRALGITPAYLAGENTRIFTPIDTIVTKQFQNAQGWSGDDADGFPGPETLRRLALDPAKAPTASIKTVRTYGNVVNMGGNNPHGMRTGLARVKRFVGFRKISPVDVINVQEATVAFLVRPTLDRLLKPLGVLRAGGGEGRYTYLRNSVTKIASGMYTVPSKHWYKKDDKQASWAVYFKDGALALDLGLHLEHESGAVADGLRVLSAIDIANFALATADKYKVPHANIALTGDTNSEAAVVAALVERGWRNAAKGTKFEKQHTYQGWDGKARKRFDYVLVLDTAPHADLVKAEVTAVSNDTDISDHASIRYARNLIVLP